MAPVFYTNSEKLTRSLKMFDMLREQTLGIPLDAKTELRLQFETTAAKIFYALLLFSNEIRRSDVVNTLSLHTKRNPNRAVQNYHNALKFIGHEWISNKDSVSPWLCRELYEFATYGNGNNSDISEMKHMLDYVQVSREHPLVAAALIFLLFAQSEPFGHDNRLFASLLFELFLAKNGYHCNNLFCINHYFFDHRNEFEQQLERALSQDNVTSWLEYVTEAAILQLRFVKDVVEQKGILFRTDLQKSFWKLTDRQKKVVALSHIPQARLTNKKIQGMFGVSQITASRDLSKLAILGLLHTRGRGRSVYYTAV